MFAFDILYLDGEDVTQKPYQQRRKLLEKILNKENATVRLAEVRVLKIRVRLLNF